MRRRTLLLGTALLGGLGVALAVVLRRDGPRAPEATYVGGAACAECHEQEATLWAGSDHDLAMEPATPESVLGDFDGATLTAGDVSWTFSRRDGAFLAQTEGAAGEPVELRVDFTFGADPLQQYLVGVPGGRLQVLPVAWDARPAEQGGQRWFHLYPGGEADLASPLHWTRPSQTWNSVCAECHSTGLSKGFDPTSGTFETTWIAVDVSCEACHGPGSKHVALARAPRAGPEAPDGDWGLQVPSGDPGRAWTLAPGERTARRAAGPTSRVELEACAPCHARRARVDPDPTAGSGFLDAYEPSLLRAGLYHADGQILDEVYVYGSFLQSRMYRAGVTCSDCHDPHRLGLRAEGNALCTRCHLADAFDVPSHTLHEPASTGARCVECHMPATTYMLVDPRRDHSLRVPRPDLSVALGVPNACTRCHTDRSDAWAAEALAGRRGTRAGSDARYARAVQAGRRGDPAALESLTRVAGDTAVAAIRRATALSLLGAYPPSRALAAVRAGLADADPLVRVGALQALDALGTPEAVRLAAPRVDDPTGAVWAEAARVLSLHGGPPADAAEADRFARALDIYERVQNANADHASSWVALGDAQAARGRAGDAEASYRKALAIDSTEWAAYLNLADLQRALGRDDLAEATLWTGLARAPETPELMHAMGLLRVRQGEAAEALGLLERAASARPEAARFGYVHGVALWSAGDTVAALRALERTLARHPFERDVLAALATYSRELGRGDEALRYARRRVEVTPDDPSARALLRELGG